MSTPVFINNYSVTLAAAITSTATTIIVSSATGLPTLLAGEILPITLLDAATKSVYEIVYTTAISGTSLTVLRGQEATVASAYAAGDFVMCNFTAKTVEPVNTISPASAAVRISSYVDGLVGTPVRLLSIVFADQISFPANMTGAEVAIGVNPATAQSLTVSHNGASIGTFAVSTAGVVTWTTTAFTSAPGDTLTIAGPGTADTTWADLTMTLLGTLVALG